MFRPRGRSCMTGVQIKVGISALGIGCCNKQGTKPCCIRASSLGFHAQALDFWVFRLTARPASVKGRMIAENDAE